MKHKNKLPVRWSFLWTLGLLLCFWYACTSENKSKDVAIEGETTGAIAAPAGDTTVSPVVPEGKKKQHNSTAPVGTVSKSVEEPTVERAVGVAAGKEDKVEMLPEDMIYNEFPSKRAAYPGGASALNKYLSDHIRYPASALEHKVEGTVYANLHIDESGAIVDITYHQPLGYGLEEEVTRVIKGMPKLIPAEDQGVPVKTKWIVPVKFDLK